MLSSALRIVLIPSVLYFAACTNSGWQASSPSVAPQPPLSFSEVSTGIFHTCAVTSLNVAYCWGVGEKGKLGTNKTDNSTVPVAVYVAGDLQNKGFKSVSAGGEHTCGITTDDLAYCWGGGAKGQLGNKALTDSAVPVAVDTSGVLAGKTIKSLSAGESFTCALASDDKVYCWGGADSGQLGNNSLVDSNTPVAVDTAGVLSGKTVKVLSVGGSFACVIASDDNAYCWGSNSEEQIGNNNAQTGPQNVPVAVDTSGVLTGKTVKSLSAGATHACAIASDDKAYCWGMGEWGQLGNNGVIDSLVPVAVDVSGVLQGKTLKSISAGGYHTCAVASDDLAYCWGYRGEGQLGNNDMSEDSDLGKASSKVPVAVDTSGVLSGKRVLQVSSGALHSCAIAVDSDLQKVYCWGSGAGGLLGNNDTNTVPYPVAIIAKP